jgi:predicted membrane-bound dolichyl-phosphate-mannose-protein mannosyltransferase
MCIYGVKPECGFIFDEAHYVRAVRQIVLWSPTGEYHPNIEHPPLVKVLIMLGVMILGDNPWGWRIFPALSGVASIYLLGLIAYQLTRDEKLSLIAAALFAFDITSFNLSSMAILDPTALMFSLLGTLSYFRRNTLSAGIALGLALLCKLSTMFVIATLLIVELLTLFRVDDCRSALKISLKHLGKMLLSAFVILILGLWIYDYYYQIFPNPLMHLNFMLRYHSTMLTPNPSEGASPLSWTNPILQFPRVLYAGVYTTIDDKIYYIVAYYGEQTPLWWMTWGVIGFSAYFLAVGLKDGEFSIQDCSILAWLACNYISYFPISLLRPVYSFYFYANVPIVALGISRLLRGDRATELMLYGLLAAQLAYFILFFPVKPLWLVMKLVELGLPQ